MLTRHIWLVLVCGLSILLVVKGSYQFCMVCCPCGEVSPNDPYVLTTQQLVLYCKLNNDTVSGKGINASGVEFIHRNNQEPVSTNYTSIVNETTLMLNVTVDSMSQNGTYWCRVKEEERHKLEPEKKYFVGGQAVTVEYFPQEISDKTIKCVVFDWFYNMTCSWTPPDVKYYNPSNIQTIVSWSNIYPYNDFNICESQNIKDNQCTISSSEAALDVGYWVFLFEVKNTELNISSYSRYLLNDSEHVKPSKVKDFTAVAINSSCIKLNWNHSHMQTRHMFFEISHKSKWDSVSQKFNTSRNVTTKTICNLIPYTVYSFTIGCYPKVKGYRSDLVEEFMTTKEDVPAVPPGVSNGSFISRLEDCRPDKNLRNVTIYWKNIPEKLQNGRLREFTVEYKDGDVNVLQSVSPNKTWAQIQLACDKSYTVNINGKTAVGFSQQAATVRVPGLSARDISPPVEVIPVFIEAYNTSSMAAIINVSWTPPNHSVKNITGFTVYWCSYLSAIGNCDSEIEWKPVTVNKSSIEIDIANFQRNTLFGVSMETDRGSSGFKWEHCIYKNDAEPKPPKVSFGQSPPENGLTITWTVEKCDTSNEINSPYIVGYKVGYCEADHVQKKCVAGKEVRESELIPFSTAASAPRYDVRDLKASKRYGVGVKSVSWNKEGQYSNFIFDVPVNNDLLPGYIAAITIAAVFVFALALAGLIFCIRSCKKKTEEARKPYEIDVPTIKFAQNGGLDLSGYRYSTLSEPSSPVESDRPLLPNGIAHGMMNGNIPTQRQVSTDSGHESLNSDTVNTPQTDQQDSQRSANDILETVKEENDHSGLDIDQSKTDESSLSSYHKCIGSEPDPYSNFAVVIQSDSDSEESSDSENSVSAKLDSSFVPPVELPTDSTPKQQIITVAHLTDVQLDNKNLLCSEKLQKAPPKLHPVNSDSGSASEVNTAAPVVQINGICLSSSSEEETDQPDLEFDDENALNISTPSGDNESKFPANPSTVSLAGSLYEDNNIKEPLSQGGQLFDVENTKQITEPSQDNGSEFLMNASTVSLAGSFYDAGIGEASSQGDPVYEVQETGKEEQIAVTPSEDRTKLPVNASTVSLAGSIFNDGGKDPLSQTYEVELTERDTVPSSEDRTKLPVNASTVSLAGSLFNESEQESRSNSEQVFESGKSDHISIPLSEDRSNLPVNASTVSLAGSLYNDVIPEEGDSVHDDQAPEIENVQNTANLPSENR